jgi:hypothetical protein
LRNQLAEAHKSIQGTTSDVLLFLTCSAFFFFIAVRFGMLLAPSFQPELGPTDCLFVFAWLAFFFFIAVGFGMNYAEEKNYCIAKPI